MGRLPREGMIHLTFQRQITSGQGRKGEKGILETGNRRFKRPTDLDGVGGALQTSVLHPTTVTQGWRGKIIKCLVEAFGLYPKYRRFKERMKIITFVI